MALKPPGSTSGLSLFFSSLWTIIMLLMLIGGHLVLVVLAFLYIDQNAGMDILVKKTGLPDTLLWASIVMGLLMDVWIFFSGRQAEKKANRR